MKLSKLIALVAVFALLGFGWIGLLNKNASRSTEVTGYLRTAEESVEQGLYEQGIEFYKKAIDVNAKKGYYTRVKEIYDMFYKEEHEGYVHTMYTDDMLAAAEKYPEDAMFWNTAIALQLEAEDYRDAYDTVKKAIHRGVKDEQLNKYKWDLECMTDLDFRLYNSFVTANNGYMSVTTTGDWILVDDTGEEITSEYEYIGLINDNGYGIYKDNNEFRLLDENQIIRARFGDMQFEKTGYYSESCECFPAMMEGKWAYVKKDKKIIADGFDVAGSFYDGKAVARKNGKWMLVAADGKTQPLDKFEDIKLDLYGCHQQSDVIIAKENGKYHLYDAAFNRIGDFACEDIDICINGGLIAFKEGGKWGFIDKTGKIVVKPKYANAKSFSNGYAAICDDGGLWGFINTDFKEIVPGKFVDAMYFTSNETCLVSQNGSAYQLLNFMF